MVRIEIGKENSCTGGNDDNDVKVSLVRNELEVVLCICILELNELDPAFGARTLARPPISAPKSKNSQSAH